MQLRTFIISAGVHVAIGFGLMHAVEERRARKATAVSFEDKKPEKKEKPPTPKPPPPPKPAAPKPTTTPTPTTLPAPTPMTAPTTVAPSVGTDIHLSNDGPGIPIGDAQPQHVAHQAAAAPKPVAAKPPPAPKEEGSHECTEEATKPVAVVKVNPEYTDAARAAGVEGRLVVRIFVGPDGSVAKVEVVNSVDPALDAAAIATIQKWRFTPAMKCGKPVDGGVYVFAQRFELAGD